MKIAYTIIFCIFTCLGWSQTGNYGKIIEEHRVKYKKKFLADPRTPLDKNNLSFLKFYKAKKKYNVACSVQLTPDEIPFEMPTYSGITKTFRKYAVLTFELKGKTYTLSAYQNLKMLTLPMYKSHLFIPFKDLTNGKDTYGGGRYIDAETSDIVKNVMTLDFNKSYNPWCAYSDGYNCPIPPGENHLDIRLKVGEKMYAGIKKKSK